MKLFSARSVILLLVVVSAVLAGLLIDKVFEEEEEPVELNALQTEVEALKLMLQDFEAIVAIDEMLLFEGDWNEPKARIEQLIDSKHEILKPYLERRLEYINDAYKEQRDDNQLLSQKDQLIRNQRKRVEELELVIDSLSNVFVNRLDSLNESREDIRAELKRKENELKKQEKVKVISFSGVKGSTIHYMGEVENGKANGGGIGIWTTGSVYRGEWKDNLRHGKGAFEWADGERYEGDYIEGRREGDGVYYWPSGERYEGQWKNDRRTGSGILYDLDGNIRYDGMWKDDKPLSK